jgi:hypothetical protein
MKHNSIISIIDDWVKRSERYRMESEDLHKSGCPVESGIQFGRQGATRICAEELLQFIDYLQKQVHVVGVGLLSFQERYPSSNFSQCDDQNAKNIQDKKAGQKKRE